MDRIGRMRKEHAQGVRETVGTALTVGTAFGVGWFEGRYPDKNVMGIPPSLVVGGVLVGLAAFEVGGKEESRYIMDAGKGSLAAWSAGRGGELGRDQLAKAA